ncbi:MULTISPECIES: hypothetical protein [unclassified Streptomyces]|uniref:hypothetical protein n=1 Tax=unclassified Streptomyces TaxID=2593676 RepID=UPI00211D8520|nr:MULTISPECIES: hypothetical protein [unclassified Streptomyces]
MSTVPTLPSGSHERPVVGLRRRTVVAGDYLVLVSGDAVAELDEWDHGLWHEPLTKGDGGSYSAVWGSTFDHYEVELHPAPMSDFLSLVGKPGGAACARAIDGLEKALAGLGLLEEALALDLRRPQHYFHRLWSLTFRARDLADAHDDDTSGLPAITE